VSYSNPAETIEAHGCSIVVRTFEGPEARELFLSCEPPSGVLDAGEQAEAVYRAILDVLEAEGGSFSSVVWETLFLRNAYADRESIRAARGQVLAASDESSHRPATTEIEQPPLNEQGCLEVSIQAVLPNPPPLRVDSFVANPTCGCAECARSHGVRVRMGGEARFYIGGLCGRGENAYEQTLDMFGVAEGLLRQAGMEFGDVVRTWIYLRDMERDYAALNRARRDFFTSRGIDPAPASTGIGGGPVARGHDLCIGLYGVQSVPPPVRTVMTTPTLNEAPLYGSDFSRGTRIIETNKVALHVSGTASIDEAGRTVHLGDFEAQVDRMLVNVAKLLEGQGATFGDIVSAVTYLKDPKDAERLRVKLQEAGFEGFPNVLVAAPVCRPELLCETEALAVLPKPASSNEAG
jgi:enamine deaminase RidA (YjgF/YER057c/UK114 family)